MACRRKKRNCSVISNYGELIRVDTTASGAKRAAQPQYRGKTFVRRAPGGSMNDARGERDGRIEVLNRDVKRCLKRACEAQLARLVAIAPRHDQDRGRLGRKVEILLARIDRYRED